MSSPGVVRVGMSGFSFQSWRGAFYPERTPADAMLAYYAQRFETVELNNTFYRTPAPDAVDGWREAVPPAFRFAVKALRWVSYTLRPSEHGEAVSTFVSVVARLGDRLGPVLFQAPRGARFDEGRVVALLDTLPPGRRYALEGGHESFRTPEAHALLRKHGVASCWNDDAEPVEAHVPTSDVAYLRFRRESYDDAELVSRARRVGDLAESGADVYVFFRHQDSPACVLRALEFRALVAGD